MRLFTVDAFTKIPFEGNPAGVCVLGTPFTDETSYIKIAQEINYAETAFVYPKGENYHLRWFTPTTEIKLCGHATLATAKILFEKFNYSGTIIHFETLSGLLSVKKENDLLVMNFPMEIAEKVATISPEIHSFINQTPKAVLKNKEWHIVHLNNEEAVKNFKPNFSSISDKPLLVVVTASSDDKTYDFVSRVFAPYYGISEDPVTGSAHCYLASYWSKQLQKNTLIGHQVSKRTGVVSCEVLQNNRILLKGNAVIMSELLIEWKL